MVVAALLALIPVSASCAREDCSTISCGPGFSIVWEPGQVPQGATYEVCLNDDCESSDSSDRIVLGDDSITSHTALKSGKDGRVTLDVQAADGSRVAFYEGTAHFSGGCCPTAHLRPTDDGALEAM